MILQVCQSEDVEIVSFIRSKEDKDTEQVGVWNDLLAFDNLVVPVELNFQKRCDRELPGWTIDGFDLNRHGMPRKIGGKQIIIRHVARKRRCHDPHSPEFCHDQMFTNLSRELSGISCLHFSFLRIRSHRFKYCEKFRPPFW